MQDIQNSPAQVPVAIDRVGINNFRLPLVVSDKANGCQHTVALVDLGVDLPAEFKGTHMSRFVEALENWNEELSYATLKKLLMDIKSRLSASKAYARFRFTYFLRKHAPITNSGGLMGYECTITGELSGILPGVLSEEIRPHLSLAVEVPVLTVCPCSKAISENGAHSQRAMVRISVRQKGFAWLEEFIDIAEQAASSPVYPLLKREDEKEVTEKSFANPCFVEDVVRNAAKRLAEHPQVSWFRVEVESMESIHSHNAFACIERTI
ncbi:MAG: GTP cyclohydrolase FolE2 [Deltaproteobacteria bacterium]|jgi:GTP cyclohydrolase I|nr:GTP cyclohydrolase FolE2 [Deltaproteobacteria bacterium]